LRKDTAMILFPNAKINLGLQITGKRGDGFHEIRTGIYPVPLLDAVEIIISKKMTFTATGLAVPGTDKDNLILKGYHLLKKDFNDLPPVSIYLHKTIPVGAGLGGGSSDAAFALKLMNNLFDLHLDDWLLEEYAALLGSDCPFFVENTPKIASGRGELLEPLELDLTGKWVALVNPGLQISTKEAYQGITPKPAKADLREILSDPMMWKTQLINDFEEGIFKKYPELAALKNKLYDKGAFYSAMSGSGSTVFGLFEQEPELGTWPEGYFVFKAGL